MKYLTDLFSEPISGEWGEETEGEGTKVIRTTNFTNIGKLDFVKGIAIRRISDKKVVEKRLQYGDVIIEKSGGSPEQPVGRVVFFNIENEVWLCNNFTAILRPKQGFHPKYCFYLMYYLHKSGAVLKYQNKTTGIINLKLNDYLKHTKVSSLPPLETQKKIAAVLDKTQELIDKRKEQLAKLDEFVQSVFLEMFGDPILLTKKRECKKLENIANVQSGFTLSGKRMTFPIIMPYLRVANIYRNKLDLTEIKTVGITESEYERLKLKMGDILIVEGHGNPREIGRAAVWDETIKECVHQNHLIRVRLVEKVILPLFLSYVINSALGQKYFCEESRTTSGLNTISTGKVKSFDCPVPPLDLQNKFAAIVEKTEQQKALMQQSLTEMENNFNSLMQQAFKGELF